MYMKLSTEGGLGIDRGHQVGNAGLCQEWGSPRQTFSMCNVGPQTASLNERKWQYLEGCVNTLGQDYADLVIVGS